MSRSGRAWARRFFPDADAVGKRFREGGCTSCPWTTVVGVVSEVKYAGLDKPDQGTVYWALPPGSRFRCLLVRTGAAPSTVAPALRHALRRLDPSLPLSGVATVDELVAGSLQRPRSLSLLVGALAIVGYLVFGPGASGSKAEWFFGAVVLVAMMLTMWLTLTIQRQSKNDVARADERLRRELRRPHRPHPARQVGHQLGEVLEPVAERGELDGEDVQPEE